MAGKNKNKEIKKLSSSLEKSARGLFPFFEAEAVHRFRVSYKKLRACLRLIHHGQEKKFRMPGSLKRLYENLGVVRDAQVQRHRLVSSLVASVGSIDHCINSLGHAIHVRLLPVKRKETLQVIRKAISGLTECIDEKITAEQWKTYVRDLTAGIQSHVFAGEPADTDLHEARKRVKDLYYNLGYIPVSLLNTAPVPDAAELNKLAQSLGEFQDHVSALSMLYSQIQGTVNEREASLLGSMEAEWKGRKARAREQSLHGLALIFGNDATHTDVHG